MPDLLAGTIVKADDTPVTLTNEQSGSYTATNTTFGIGTTGGTYVDCGLAFLAPTTGRVLVLFSLQGANNTAGAATEVSPFIREGAVVGSGTTFLASVIDNKVRLVSAAANSIQHAGNHKLVEGLTPGDTYNVRLDHRVSGTTGTFVYRKVTVVPCP